MSEPAIRLRDVAKGYVVYARPHYWLADFLGLGRFLEEGRHFRRVWALRDVTLDVPRGAKVALVGRNGAGKSTLLRIVSDNLAPSSGRVEVHGRCEALMQLGAGFNPEATGRENIESALAYMGVSAAAVEEKIVDVLRFAELEDFIDHPVRTYSSGMYLRLAFSVATTIAPEILIVDEILGAGDLYFQAKCLERMQDLTAGRGTTVLFVSHDLEAAQRLCDTFVWLDRGRIMAVGPSAEVRAQYEDAVRRQHDRRLRARNLRLTERVVSALDGAQDHGFHLVGRLRCAEGTAHTAPFVRGLRLLVRGTPVDEIRVGDAMDDQPSHPSFVVAEPDTAWGPPVRRGDVLARAVQPGRAGRGAPFALFVHYDDFNDPGYELALEVQYQDTSALPCGVEVHAGPAGLKHLLTLEHDGDGAWKSARAVVPRWMYAPGTSSGERPAPALDGAGPGPLGRPGAPVERAKRFGTGQVLIDTVRFRDEHGRETYLLRHGSAATVELAYHAEDPGVVGGTMVCALGIQAPDGLLVSAMISSAQSRVFPVRESGSISIRLAPLLLGNGTYRLTAALFTCIDLHGLDPHFTASPFLLDMLARAHEFQVEGAYPAESWVFRHPVEWTEGDRTGRDERREQAGRAPAPGS